MKKRLWMLWVVVIIAAGMGGGMIYAKNLSGQTLSEERAATRVQEFAYEVNYHYETPESIYPYLTAEYRETLSCEAFVRAFKKERSYPYLTPLFINYDTVVMAEDLLSGRAVFSQAARLPGMIYEVGIVYENGDYYIQAFEEFLDDSYLEKFDRLD